MYFIIWLVAIVFLGYILFIICGLVKMKIEKNTINKAIRTKRITDSDGKIYYVIPWPEADKKGWVKHMKYLEKNPDQDDFAYMEEWSNHKDEHDKI